LCEAPPLALGSELAKFGFAMGADILGKDREDVGDPGGEKDDDEDDDLDQLLATGPRADEPPLATLLYELPDEIGIGKVAALPAWMLGLVCPKCFHEKERDLEIEEDLGLDEDFT